ncbi:hypothetical protein NCC78_03180 [Micromonospora phytophila]|uniref:hypothetical protein n=1 Tax=Micromonospora phytophila TaxID=709888 RepID=UPI00202F187B|nr:hypothetical protein [Micromonospora phytophila]MCM0673715.1 hypothetical protein [Micromonospora phytophila]
MGLALHDPTQQVFATGVIEVSVEWTSAALTVGAVAAYGVASLDPHTPGAGPSIGDSLRDARRAGRIAAGYMSLRW